ncbi:hypothetical protein HK101_011061, partial [Irineochytrium annulatum]
MRATNTALAVDDLPQLQNVATATSKSFRSPVAFGPNTPTAATMRNLAFSGTGTLESPSKDIAGLRKHLPRPPGAWAASAKGRSALEVVGARSQPSVAEPRWRTDMGRSASPPPIDLREMDFGGDGIIGEMDYLGMPMEGGEVRRRTAELMDRRVSEGSLLDGETPPEDFVDSEEARAE